MTALATCAACGRPMVALSAPEEFVRVCALAQGVSLADLRFGGRQKHLVRARVAVARALRSERGYALRLIAGLLKCSESTALSYCNQPYRERQQVSARARRRRARGGA